MSSLKVTSAKEVEMMGKITNWSGEINTPLGALLRTKAYECFNRIIYRIGRDISIALNSKDSDAEKLKKIEQILISNNLRTGLSVKK
jgi:hypothetical protein